MLEKVSVEEAIKTLLEKVNIIGKEIIPLEEAAGRVLAFDLKAKADIPPFDRSPLDGYAFRAQDSKGASKEKPLTLEILEEVPAGAIPTKEVTKGTAVKILTGAPIPKGADAVCAYELTEFSPVEVKIFSEFKSGENIIYAGEDVKCGDLLAVAGTVIDTGLMGVLASENISEVEVFKQAKIAIVSTGNELIEPGENLKAGKIYNSNRFSLTAALKKMGLVPVNLGNAGDDAETIAKLVKKGLETCECLITTGGVSVGDYDKTPEAFEKAGATLLIKGVAMKPGMACCYGEKDGKLLLGLSGNPASSLINLYVVCMPALLKASGRKDFERKTFEVIAGADFKKQSKAARFIRGKLLLKDGKAYIDFPKNQGNVVLSSLIESDLIALIPAASGPIEKGTILKAFRI